MNLKHIKNCRICGNPHLDKVLDLGMQFNQGNFILPNKPVPPFRKMPLEVLRCNTQKYENGCGLIQNSVVVPPEVLYMTYGYKSSISATMRAHLKSIVNRILEIKPEIENGLVCDVGANDSYFLSQYPENTKKIGIDPSDVAKNVKQDNLTMVNECFPSDKLDIYSGKIDCITAIACLYDIDNLDEFIGSIKQLLKKDGIAVFEVAYLLDVLDKLAFDERCFEHVSLFSLSTLERIFGHFRLKIFKAERTPTNGGSLLIFVCHDNQNFGTDKEKENLLALKFDEFEAQLDESGTYEDFEFRVINYGRELKETLEDLKRDGKTIALYACSTKINTVIQSFFLEEYFDYGIEKTEEKIGGSTMYGLSIIGEKEARERADENTVWFIGPYSLKTEILNREIEFRNKGGKFLIPLPQIEII